MNFSFNQGAADVLPGSAGTLSDGLTLGDAADGGIIIENIQKDSPVARAGTLKKGDQLNAVTIHFDNLDSKEVSKILKYSEPYKTSLKLNADEELMSPDFRFSSPGMGSDDQAYLKLYNNKIKPHLKPTKPDLSIDGPDIDINGKNKMSSFGIKGPRLFSDIDMNLEASKDVDLKLPTNIDLTAPKIEADIKGPSLDIDTPRLNGANIEGNIKSPSFQKPSFSIPGAKMDVSVPESKAGIKSPDIDIGEANVPGTQANWKMPKLQIPSFGISGPKGPDVDLDGSVRGPNVDMSAPKIKGNFAVPNVDLNLPKGDIDANIPDAELNKQKFKMPKFNLPSGKLSLSSNDKELKMPKGQVDLSAPDLQGDIRGPSLDMKGPNIDVNAPSVNVPEAKGKWKMPKLEMPSFGISGPKGPDVDLDGSVRGPNVDVSAPNIKGNFAAPNVDLNLPKGDIDANIPDAEFNKRRLKMPKFHLPNLSGPDAKLNLNAPTVTSDVDAQLKVPKLKKPSLEVSGLEGPNVNLDGKVKLPKADISAPEIKTGFGSAGMDLDKPTIGADYDMPDMNLDVPDVKLKSPGIKMPSLNMSGKGVSIPDVDANLPTANIDLAAPKIHADVKSPNIDTNAPNIDGFGTEGKIKFPKFKKSTFSISGNKLEGPKLDASTPDLKTDIKAPDVDIGGLKGSVDVPEAKGKWKMRKLEMPSFGFSGPKKPDVDLDGSVKAPGVDLSVPDVKGDFDVPNVDLNLPKGDIDANIPDAELRGGNFKLPGFKLPSGKSSLSSNDQGLKMPKGQVGLSAPDLQGDIRGPSLNMKGPNIDVNAPSVDVPEAKGKWKMPKLEMPSFGISGPKGPDVDLDGSVRGPNVDVSVPNTKGNFAAPNVDINLPKGDIDTNIPDAELGGGNFKLPGFKLPSGKLSLSSKGKGLKMPKGQVDLPAPDLQGDIRGPSRNMKGPNIDVKAPSVDVPEAKGKWKMPKLELPSFGISGPKGPDVDLDGSVRGPNVDVSAPNIKGNFAAPNVDLNLPKGDIDANIPDAELRGGNFKLPGFKLPGGKSSLSSNDQGLKMPKGQVDLPAPDLQGDIRGPSLNMKGPNIDVNAPSVDVPEAKGKWKMPKLEMPSFGISGPKGPDVDLDGSVRGPNVDVSAPNIKGNFAAPNVDLNLPKGDIDTNIPDAELKGGNFKLPGFNLPNLSGPDAKLNLNAPTVTSDVDAQLKVPKLKKPSLEVSGLEGSNVNLDGKVKLPKADISAPEIKTGFGSAGMDLGKPTIGAGYDMPDMNLDVPDVKLKSPGIKIPSLNMSGKGVSIPDVDANLPTANIDLAAPKIQADVKSPNLDTNAPNVDGFGTEGKIKFPKFKKPMFSISGNKPEGPKLNASAPDLKTDIKAPDVDIGGLKGSVDIPETKGKWKMPKLELPSFGFSGPKKPDVDLDGSVKAPGVDLSVPDVKGDFDVPNVDLNLPKGDIDANIPDAELKGGNFKLPGFKLPSSKLSSKDKGLKMPKGQVGLSAPDLQGDIRGPSLDMKGPNIDVNAPNVDVPEAKGKWKMPKLELPSFGISGPKGPDVDLDGSVDVPDVNVSVPKVKGNYETPNVDLNLPKVDIDANIPDAELNKRKLKFPKFTKPNLGMSGIEGSSVSLGGNVQVPTADISAPEIKTAMGSAGIDLKKPAVSGDFDMPGMNLEIPDAKVKGPSLNKPSLNMSPGNVSIPDVDINLPTHNVRGDAGIHMPGGGAQARKLKGPNIDIKDAKVDVNSPNLHGDFREVGVDVSTPNLYAQVNAPRLNVGNDENINTQNTFSRETFKIRAPSLSDLDDISTVPKSDSNLKGKTSSTLHVTDAAESKKGKFKFPNFFNFSHKSKGSVDFTKAKEASSSGTFTSKFPELELAVSKD
ncbi:uncharacterized protein LOC144504363 [Mustelus asterias]